MEQNFDLGPGPLYIKLVEEEKNVRTVNLSEMLKPDFSPTELSIEIEVLEAKEKAESPSA
jgi:hypothetical protein